MYIYICITVFQSLFRGEFPHTHMAIRSGARHTLGRKSPYEAVPQVWGSHWNLEFHGLSNGRKSLGPDTPEISHDPRSVFCVSVYFFYPRGNFGCEILKLDFCCLT